MPGRGTVPVPGELFDDFLPRVSDLAELKAVLHVVYLSLGRGRAAVPLHELLRSDVIRSIVGLETPVPAEDRLRRVLDRAVSNGFLYRIAVERGLWFLPATRDGRRLLDRLRSGDESVLDELGLQPTAEVTIQRPNAFALYEQHIGPLTPLVAERLRDAERSYPRTWVEEAILTAAHYGRRNWRYIEAILLRWEAAGGPGEVTSGRV